MFGLVVALSVSLIGSLVYIRKLHARLRGYEHLWQQIESIGDKNLDGTFTISIQHLEEHSPMELHATNVPTSGVRLLELDGMGSRASGFDPKAA